MALKKTERIKTEIEGVPYMIAIMVTHWEAEMKEIEVVTDKYRQWKGEDFIIENSEYRTVIDGKYHRQKAYQQEYTDYGVDVISIEIKKRNGREGWGISSEYNTDYIIDMINGVGYYLIDAKRLREFMRDTYHLYPIMYQNEGKEDYRAVSVADLIEYEIAVFIEMDNIIENKALKYQRGYSKEYNEHIQPHIDKLMYIS